MHFVRGNRAIQRHAQDGKSLLLFELAGKGRCRFLGEFSCTTWEERPGKDRNGIVRSIIVFHLVPLGDSAQAEQPSADGASLEELRRRAYDASVPATKGRETQAKQTFYQRSEAVRDYVLARADGVCESCGQLAPFKRPNGTPYLEPHHTRRVSDGGPDHPRFVGALCPNCHREVHYGSGGNEKNRHLERRLATLEPEQG